MPSRNRFVRSLASLGVALSVASCATTTASVEQTWRAPDVPSGTLTNVVTMFPSHDVALSVRGEDELARELRRKGIRATPAYNVLTPTDRVDPTLGIPKLRNAGFDGVVTMRVIDKDETLKYYRNLSQRWGGGIVVPKTVVRIEVGAYSIENNRLVWSALSESSDPAGVEGLVDDVATVVSKALDDEHVIARTATRPTTIYEL